MVWAFRAKKRGEVTHKDECARSGGQRRSERNVEELCGERHEGYGYEGGNGAGEIILGVRPVLTRMIDIPCVFGVTDVKRI